MPDHRKDHGRRDAAGHPVTTSGAGSGGSAGAANAGRAAGLKVSPYCSSLRSKKLLAASVPAMTDEDVLDRSMWCWCGETEQILGPDRKASHPEDCRKGRACFGSPFEPLL